MSFVRFAQSADFSGLEIKNVKVDVVASLPTAADNLEGRIVYYTGDKSLYYCDGEKWVLKATDSKTLNSQPPSFYLDRANHAGEQSVETIRDFDSAVKGFKLNDFSAPDAQVDVNGERVINVADPVSDGDAVNLKSLRAVRDLATSSAAGLAIKEPVRVAAVADLGQLSGAKTIEGVKLSAGDRVLVTAQANPVDNGLYTVAEGAWKRTADADADSELTPGTMVVDESSQQFWILSGEKALSPGEKAQSWLRFQSGAKYTAGNGINISDNNVISSTISGLKKVVIDIPGGTSSANISHRLGERFPQYTVYDVKSGEAVLAPYKALSENTGVIDFGVTVSSGQYKAIFIG